MAAGLEHHQAGRHEQGRQLYAEALARDPENPTALYLSGLLAFETGRPVEAAVSLQRVADLRPGNLEARLTLASIRHWLGEYAAAADAYRAVLLLDADRADALVGLANALMNLGELDAAVEATRNAVERLPNLAAAQTALAMALAANGQQPAAIGAYREAARLEPETVSVHTNLALALTHAGEAEAAIAAADRALELDPASAEAWFARGASCAALRRNTLAIEALERAVGLDPSRAASHLALGNTYFELGRGVEAEHSLNRAIAVDPTMAEAHASLGAVHMMAERPEAARRSYEAALAIDPDMITAHQNLAALLAEAGEMEQSRRHCDLVYSRQNLFIEAAPNPLRRVLILINAGSGNVPFRHLLPKDRFTRINWFVAYARPEQMAQLPDYDVVFNAIGEPDQAGPTATNVEAFVRATSRTVLNDPAKVARTARHLTPARLAGLADVVTPPTVRVAARALGDRGLAGVVDAAGLGWPVLARPIGSHGGKGLVLAATPDALKAFAMEPEGEAYLTAYRDYRSSDGFYRKYRVIFVDRRPYPYHLAISPQWLVHHASADMVGDRVRIDEELAFLSDPHAVIGRRAMAAVTAIGKQLDLDYAGLDFSVLPDGQLLVFEANATMLVHPEAPDGPFANKNPFVQAILDAVQTMVASR